MHERRALVIMPTHSHGVLIRLSIASILCQTYTNWELHIIGDGATADTVAAVESMLPLDSRIHWHSYAKSARTGEEYRDEIIRKYGTSDGFVAYLSDDDLWFPDHVALCAEALRDADVVHTLPWCVAPGHEYRYWWCNWSLPYYRREVLYGLNRIPLGIVAHTAVAYLSLPVGWESTPTGTATDHHMWRKFLQHPGLRYGFVSAPTVVHMPSSLRHEWLPEARLEELEHYAKRVKENPQGLRTEVMQSYTKESLLCIARLEAYQDQSIFGLLRKYWTRYKSRYFDRSRLAKSLRDSGVL